MDDSAREKLFDALAESTRRGIERAKADWLDMIEAMPRVALMMLKSDGRAGMAMITLDEELLRGALESDLLSLPVILDSAGCPVWLNKWLRDAWWALRRERKVEKVKAAIEKERAQEKPKSHTCDKMPQGSELRPEVGGWTLVEVEETGWREIDYCPFCGEKLDA